MLKTKWILLVIFLAGVLILLLPDEGRPVIRFNKMHGPSLPDLVGLVLILICWIGSCVLIARNWQKIKPRVGERNIYLLIVVYLLSCFCIGIALVIESDWLLWSSVSTASIINFLFIALCFSKE